MRYQLLIISIIFIFCGILKAQSIDDLLIPSKEVVRIAKSNTKQSILELKDSLELSHKEMRIRNFEILPCSQTNWIDAKFGKLSLDYVSTQDSCFFFQHRTSYKGSYYTIDFIFDLNGRIEEKKVQWFMVVN